MAVWQYGSMAVRWGVRMILAVESESVLRAGKTLGELWRWGCLWSLRSLRRGKPPSGSMAVWQHEIGGSPCMLRSSQGNTHRSPSDSSLRGQVLYARPSSRTTFERCLSLSARRAACHDMHMYMHMCVDSPFRECFCSGSEQHARARQSWLRRSA